MTSNFPLRWLGIIPVLYAGLLWPLLRAQGESPVVSLQFRLLAWDAGIPEIIYKSGGKAVALKIAAFSPTEEQKYTGSGELDFFQYRELPEGRKLVKIGSASLAPDVRQVLLLLFPQADATYRVVPVVDDLGNFPRGKARLYNGTPYRLAIKVNQEVLQLEPGGISMTNGSENRLAVRIAYNNNGQWKKAGNNVFEVGESMRQSLFFVSSESEAFRGSSYPIQVITLPDRDLPEDPPPR